MSVIDEYEHRRGPVTRRKPRRQAPGAKVNPKEVQIALKLMGGLTPGEKKRGTPFDDEIPF